MSYGDKDGGTRKLGFTDMVTAFCNADLNASAAETREITRWLLRPHGRWTLSETVERKVNERWLAIESVARLVQRDRDSSPMSSDGVPVGGRVRAAVLEYIRARP